MKFEDIEKQLDLSDDKVEHWIIKINDYGSSEFSVGKIYKQDRFYIMLMIGTGSPFYMPDDNIEFIKRVEMPDE